MRILPSPYYCSPDSLLFNLYLFIWLHQALVVACGIKFSDRESNLGPLRWKLGSLVTVTSRDILAAPVLPLASEH